MEGTDRIEKQVVLRAPKARVWRALTDAGEFGTWFKVALKGPFVAGKSASGNLTYPGYEHLTLEIQVESLEPESHFSWRWHPYAVDPRADYSQEPATLVEFFLKEVEGGTLLKVVESGFDRIPAVRRDEAYRMNTGGWEQQLGNIATHVGR